MVHALIALGANADPEDTMLAAKLFVADAASASQSTAHRLIEKRMVVDPEHLVFDVMSERSPEVVVAAQQALNRVRQYVREQPLES